MLLAPKKSASKKQPITPPKPSGLSKETKMEKIRLITRKLVTRDSGLASLMLWIEPRLGRDDLQAYAYTNGEHIYYCDAFFTLPEEQQLAVVIHETLHVVLRHSERFKTIRMSKGGDFNAQVANICADAIVIRAIKQAPKIGPLSIVNPYVVTAEDIVDAADLKGMAGHLWTFEMLYFYMMKKVDNTIKKFLAEHGEGDQDLQPDQDPGSKPSDRHSEEVAERVWRERFKRAAAGSEPGSILREVSKDLPETKTPWEKHFREFMIAHVMPTTTIDWGRPSRRLLASKGRLGYYEPGIQRDLGVKTAGVVIDTSGSIDEVMLNKFIAETNTIMAQTGCSVVLISADAAVHSVDRFNEAITGKYEAKGGGGTDFRPALAELAKHEIDCCVYLTDMMGAFPDKAPAFPVMWATLIDQEPPFGRKVLVEHLNA